jgi:Fe-S-cluster containining protein
MTSSKLDDWTEIAPGTRWNCLRCGRCCRRDWAINLTWKEYDRIRADGRFDRMVIDTFKVNREEGTSHPVYVVSGGCPLLDRETSLCTVYEERPYTCAVYPFLMMPDGTILGHEECPGFGHGEKIDLRDLKRVILKERKRAGIIVSENP